MAALVSNLTRAFNLGGTALTRAVVAGADSAMIDGFISTSNGIDGTSSANFFENAGTAVVTDDWYSAWAAFPGAATYDMSAVDRAFVCHYKVGSATGGGGVDLNWLNQVYVVETGTSGLTAQESALLNDISSVKTQTDRLTFTEIGIVDANIHYVNDVEVNGTGSDGDEWGP